MATYYSLWNVANPGGVAAAVLSCNEALYHTEGTVGESLVQPGG